MTKIVVFRSEGPLGDRTRLVLPTSGSDLLSGWFSVGVTTSLKVRSDTGPDSVSV